MSDNVTARLQLFQPQPKESQKSERRKEGENEKGGGADKRTESGKQDL